MDTFGKVIIAAAAAAAAVVAAKKIIDDISGDRKDSKIINGYKKIADKVSDVISDRKKDKGWNVDFIDDEMDDAFTIDFGSNDDKDDIAFSSKDDADDFDGVEFDLGGQDDELDLDFDQPEDGSMTEEELQDFLEEEAAQEQIDKILDEIDSKKEDEE